MTNQNEYWHVRARLEYRRMLALSVVLHFVYAGLIVLIGR